VKVFSAVLAGLELDLCRRLPYTGKAEKAGGMLFWRSFALVQKQHRILEGVLRLISD
jgi:hypothetical protein